jgi:hypothetical protein
MADLHSRMERVIEEISGNEALLETLDTDAATEMLNWGIATAKSLINRTMELDDFAAELAILPRLKAIRQSMRSIANWAAGKYTDPEDRVKLREKLLGNFRMIFGENSRLPSLEKMDMLLNQAEDKTNTPHQLILKLKQLLEEPD